MNETPKLPTSLWQLSANALYCRLCFGIVCASILLLMVSACTRITTITEYGNRIQVLSSPNKYPQCLYLNQVKAVRLTGGENSYLAAMEVIKEKVALLDGTHLFVLKSNTDDLHTTILAEAYKCPLTEDGRIKPEKNQSMM